MSIPNIHVLKNFAFIAVLADSNNLLSINDAFPYDSANCRFEKNSVRNPVNSKFISKTSPSIDGGKITDLENIQGNEGDIVIEEFTQNAFVYLNSNWLSISMDDNEKGDDNTPNKNRKVRSICSHCGGTLVPNLYSEITTCTYCDCANSTFVYKTDPEFNKI